MGYPSNSQEVWIFDINFVCPLNLRQKSRIGNTCVPGIIHEYHFIVELNKISLLEVSSIYVHDFISAQWYIYN